MRVPRKAMSGSSSDDDDWIGQALAAHSDDRVSHSAVLTRQDITVSWLLGAFKTKDQGVIIIYMDTLELEMWLQSMKNGRVVR